MSTLILGSLMALPLLQMLRLKSWVVSAAVLMLLTSVAVSVTTDFHAINLVVSIITVLTAVVLLNQENLRFGDLLLLNTLLFLHVLAAYISDTASMVMMALFVAIYIISALLKNQAWFNWLALLGLTLCWLLFGMSSYWLFFCVAFAFSLMLKLTPAQSKVATIDEQVLIQIDAAKTQERSRIYQNIHDDVGAELLKLIYELDDEQQRSRVKAVMNQLRKAVAQTAHLQISLSQLVQEIADEAAQRCQAAGIAFKKDVELNHSPQLNQSLPSHIQRVVRGLVSNVIKHAKASEVTFKVALTEQLDTVQLHLQLVDNGVGYTDKLAAGKGVKAVQARLKKIAGQIEWQKNEPQGTCVVVVVPLP